MTYIMFEDLADELPEIPADSIVSRTLYDGEDAKVVLFGFAPGQSLSEHTASRPAVLHFVHGDADLTLGEDSLRARAGSWFHMAAQLPHSITARTEVAMLLVLLGGESTAVDS